MKIPADKLIKKLIEGKVIAKVTTPTTWVSPGHFVPKPNGDVRLITDFRRLNRLNKRPIKPFKSALDLV